MNEVNPSNNEDRKIKPLSFQDETFRSTLPASKPKIESLKHVPPFRSPDVRPMTGSDQNSEATKQVPPFIKPDVRPLPEQTETQD